MARLKGFLGPLEWQEFSQLDVENYIDHARTLTAWNQKRRSLSDGTIIKDLQVLRAALRHAHLNRIVPYECRIEIRGLVAGTRTDWITQEQMRRVLRRCYTRPDRLHVLGFLLIGLCSAARREAILSLKWEQVRIPEAGWRSLSQLTALAPSPQTSPFAYTKAEISENLGASITKGSYIDFGQGLGNKRRPTPLYRPPECANNFRRATAQADIYSFGSILHDIFSGGGRIPHGELTVAGPLGPIIEKCTKTQPRRRYASIAALREDLFAVLDNTVVEFFSAEEQDVNRDPPRERRPVRRRVGSGIQPDRR